MALERQNDETKDSQPSEVPKGLQAFRFGFLYGMITRLMQESKQQKEELAALKEMVERLEAKSNQ